MEILKAEVIEVLRGTSAFGSVLLNDLIKNLRAKSQNGTKRCKLLNWCFNDRKYAKIDFAQPEHPCVLPV